MDTGNKTGQIESKLHQKLKSLKLFQFMESDSGASEKN